MIDVFTEAAGPGVITPPAWGPTGQTVYERTYQRVKPNGERESWADTVERVAEGNLSLVYGPRDSWTPEVVSEYEALSFYMYRFGIIPAGRHLWASGVKGRQYLFNCHVSGWGQKLSDHFSFSFLRLMEGGGVGANYSSRFLEGYGLPRRSLGLHIVCDPSHPDYQDMRAAGLLSEQYPSDWDGAYEVDDSREGWAAAMVDLLDTFMTDETVKHTDRVFDVTNIRAAGARLKTFGGTASGPQPFAAMLHEVTRVMNNAVNPSAGYLGSPLPQHLTPIEAMEIEHAIAECVVSGGVRRSARMSIVEWDDPYVMEFIRCKSDTDKHWTTNISVGIDDLFLTLLDIAYSGERIKPDDPPYRAERIHNAACAAMLENGEPGYWNRSLSQTGEIGEVIATNPCGEITLEAWENCNLGHVNMQEFVNAHGEVDTEGLVYAHQLATRFLMRATYGDVNDPGQAAILATNRRIGVGHLGVQGFLVKQGVKYSEAEAAGYGDILSALRKVVRSEARDYAFDLRIPEPVKVTTVAPTGSIAKLPGVSEGAHAIYGRYFIRRVRFSMLSETEAAQVGHFAAVGHKVEPDQYDKSGNTAVVEFVTKDNLVAEVEAMGLPAEIVESQDELTLDQMLSFQALYQTHWADNAVSYTANIEPGVYTADQLAETLTSYLPVLKGTTIMVDGSRPQAPYERLTLEQYEAATVTAVSDGIDEDCASGACPIR